MRHTPFSHSDHLVIKVQITIWAFMTKWSEQEKGGWSMSFVLFVICNIVTWNKVAKWVNILQDSDDRKWRLCYKCAIAFARVIYYAPWLIY